MHKLPETVTEAELLRVVRELNADRAVHGILVQLPLPRGIDPRKVIAAIDPAKDVDGFHPVNAGRLATGLPALVPCTPLGCIRLAKTVHSSLAGLEAVVIGRSNIVGKPLAQLLLAENATVTIAHSKTRDLPAVSRRADVLFAAVGRPEMVGREWIKPGATVIDVGINRVAAEQGKTPDRRRRGLRRSGRNRRRHHAGPRRGRSDDHRVPDAQHGARRAAQSPDCRSRTRKLLQYRGQKKEDGTCPSSDVRSLSALQARQANATLSSVLTPNFSEERATARPPSAR